MKQEKKPKTMELSYDRLMEVLDIDVDAGKLYWRESGKGRKIGTEAGCMNSKGYRRIKIDGVTYQAHRLIWFAAKGYQDHESVLHHINHIRDDNRIDNLEIQSGYCHARGMQANNTSGERGICWLKRNGKWLLQLTPPGTKRKKYFGSFATIEDAVKRRDELEAEWLNPLKACKITDEI